MGFNIFVVMFYSVHVRCYAFPLFSLTCYSTEVLTFHNVLRASENYSGEYPQACTL